MRSTNFSALALLASLLVREAFAAPLEKRGLVIEDVIVTEVQTVTQEADGSYKTGEAFAIGTATIQRAPQVSSTPVAAAHDNPAVQSKSSSSVASSAGGVFVAAPKSTSTPAPVTSAAPVVIAPKPVTTSPKPTPTTLATVVAPVVAPVSTPKASSTPVVSTGGSTSSSGKRGLAYNDASLLKNFLTAGSKTSWCYNWGSSTAAVPSGLEYVPMLWGLGSHVNGWKEAATAAINNGAKHLLGFNEPDLGAQSNISPKDAADGWSNMQQFAGQAKLGAPAITNGGAPMGITWLKSFLAECSGCTIDFVPFHWYDSASNFAYFKSYINDVHAAGGGRPLWLTEFGASGSVDEQNAFLKQATEYLDSLDFVERYAYFMVQDGGLVSGGGALSTLGRTFAGLS